MRPQPAPDDDDEAWIAALAGEDLPGGRAETRLEAQLLRAAARRQAAQPGPAASAHELERLQASLAALAERESRQAGAAAGRGPGARLCSGCARRWQQLRAAWARRPRGAVAAGGLILALPWLLWWPTTPPGGPAVDAEPALRGAGSTGLRVVTRPDAEQRRNSLAQQLAAQGASVRRYERLGRFGLEAQLPVPMPEPLAPGLQQALQADGLAVGSDGLLSVEFAASGP